MGGESLAVDPCIGHGLVQTILGSCSPLELPIVSHSAFNILGGSNNRGLVCHVMTSAIHPHEPFHQRVWLSRGLVCHVMTSAIHPHEPFHQRVWLSRGLVCHVMTSAIHPHEPFHQRVWLSVIGALRMAQHDAC